LGLLLFGFQSKAQWTVRNYSDCNFTFTIQCSNGANQSSNDYTDSWWGTWTSPRSKVFNMIPCCSNPKITITFDPIYGIPPITGFLNSLVSSGTVFGCYTLNNCSPANAGFVITVSGCVITLAKPPGC
jgi:hypothetical protein